jgi:hypothetical protein
MADLAQRIADPPGVECSWCSTISTGSKCGAASALAAVWNGIGCRLLIPK